METGQLELLKKISVFLETHQIPYMITGAWSAIFYGRPRASHDIDFVVEIPFWLKKLGVEKYFQKLKKIDLNQYL